MALALVYAVFIFIASSGPGVNNYAHLFGIVGGFALGLLFTRMGGAGVRAADDSSYKGGVGRGERVKAVRFHQHGGPRSSSTRTRQTPS